ncbi:flavocytochrome c [uncultured Ferrimonas sp.]|uniref:flavocytochrome c n=1 Tax=uncultured Ferrimonas sp. TaxID=432640 RepID=UPI002635CA9E|nr:flavocytochrome c [uncultured Ferrimonas sp.]
MTNNTQQARRRFLKGLGVAGAVAAAPMAAPALASSMRSDGVKWDKTVDIAIIGSGFAGLAAGIEAKRQGANNVTIFEKMPVFGGNSAINGGLYAAPATPMQKEKGVQDSVERMVADQMKAGRGIADEGLLRHVAEHAMEGLQLAIDAGAEFHPYLQQLGGHSVPRTYQTSVSCGAGITQPLLKQARKEGVETINRIKFDGFVLDKDGKVEGIKLKRGYYFGEEDSGTEFFVRATRGVIMATGGFAQNVNLRMAQDPTLTAEVGCTNAKGATGEGMFEMFRLGAIPVHMAHIQSGPWASPDEGGFGYVSNYSIFNFPHSIAINRMTGERFMNEIADRKTRADAELNCRDAEGKPLPPIMVTSWEHAKQHPNAKKVLKYGVGWKFDTLEALAKHFDVPLKPLQAQIEQYNQYVKSGVDEQFGKNMGKAKGKYIQAPFSVVRLWPKVHYCQGGVQITKEAKVLDSFTGKPIPNLFAAGEVTGGVHGVSRLGSCSIPECVVMGMTASRSIMQA